MLQSNAIRVRRQVTVRDHYIIAQALAYAITAIERLPEERQEWSNYCDMQRLLAAWTNWPERFLEGAKAHITGRGWAIDPPPHGDNVVPIPQI